MNDNTHPVIEVWKNDSQRKYISSYSARIIRNNLGAYYTDGGSASLNKTIAKNKAVFEAIERLSGSSIPKFLKKSSYRKMGNTVNPENFIFFARDQYNIKGFPYQRFNISTEIEWIKGKSLLDDKNLFIPAFAVYLGYNQRVPVSEKYFPTASCGLAVQTSKVRAITNGVLELIERDAAMKVWLNKLEPPVVDLSTIHSMKLRELLSNLNDEGFTAKVILSTQNVTIPSFIAIVYSSRNTTPFVTIGLSAGVDIEKTILKSIEEALMVRNSLEYTKRRHGNKAFQKNESQVKTFFDHTLYYSLPEKRNYWEFMTKGSLTSVDELKQQFPLRNLSKNTYKTLIDILRKLKYNTYAINLTTDIAKEMGLYCFKVIIPNLRQMEIDHNLKFLKYGNSIDKRKLRESKPHPFA